MSEDLSYGDVFDLMDCVQCDAPAALELVTIDADGSALWVCNRCAYRTRIVADTMPERPPSPRAGRRPSDERWLCVLVGSHNWVPVHKTDGCLVHRCTRCDARSCLLALWDFCYPGCHPAPTEETR